MTILTNPHDNFKKFDLSSQIILLSRHIHHFMACYCYRTVFSHLYIIASLLLRLLLISRFFNNSVCVCVHLAPTSFLAIYGAGNQ